VLVERRAYDEVVSGLAERFSAVRAGHHEMDLDLGAMVNAGQQRRVEGFLAKAREDGVPVLAEGRIAEGVPAGGYYVKPSCSAPCRGQRPRLRRGFRAGALGHPVRGRGRRRAPRQRHALRLVAGVWTRDAGRSMRVARAMRCGQVFVNGYGAGGGIELPFGGVKKSGHGREKGFEALYEFSASKTIVVNHG
jgi:aldehyde dehydrogenase (NAD+)